MNIIMQALAEPVHEGSSRRDTVGIEVGFLWPLGRQVGTLGQQLAADTRNFFDLLLSFLGGTETTGALLVHLCSGCLVGR